MWPFHWVFIPLVLFRRANVNFCTLPLPQTSVCLKNRLRAEFWKSRQTFAERIGSCRRTSVILAIQYVGQSSCSMLFLIFFFHVQGARQFLKGFKAPSISLADNGQF